MKKSISNLLIGLLLLFLAFLIFTESYNDDAILYNYIGPNGNFSFALTHEVGYDLHVLTYDYYRPHLGDVSLFIPFRYSPMDLEYILSEGEIDSFLINSDKIYLTRDIQLDEITEQFDYIALLTLARILDNRFDFEVYDIPVDIAVTYAPSEDFDSVVLNCSHAHPGVHVVELRLGEQNKIYREGDYCAVMEFTEDKDSIEVATRLSYQLLGVME